MTLRARLLLALLCLALLPTLVLTLFASRELAQTTERWHSRPVAHALESAIEVSRTVRTRVEATVLERADDWAAGLGPLPLSAARRAGLRDGLREAGLDLVQVYALERGRWTLREQVAPAGVLAADSLDFADELPAALDGTRLLHSRQGVLGGVARADSTEALVTGIRLTPDFFARIDDIGTVADYYRRLDVVASFEQVRVLTVALALALAVVLASFLLARTLARQMTRPLETLDRALERLASGDLQTRVPEVGAKEFRSLAASFNQMTVRLAEARASLAAAEREAVWRDVARKLAHEIKNPLTPMHLSLHRLNKRVDLVPEDQRETVRESLQALLQEVEHLTQLAEQFAQFARLPEAKPAPLDLSTLARAAVALQEPEGLHVTTACEATVNVLGDRLLLSRAIHNLLLNACEASSPGGTIEVRTGADAREGWVEILDRGSGLQADVAESVFEPYVSTKHRGSGLGLSLVRDIAQQHGGRVTLENREGGGAVARLTLPLAES